MRELSRTEVIGDALHELYRDGVQLEALARQIRDETEGSVEMRDSELEERAAKLRALSTQSLLTLTKVLGVAERLQVMADTTTESEGGAS